MTAVDAADPPADGAGEDMVVQHCPYCGSLIGSFWGHREPGQDEYWCETCMVGFAVQEVDS